MNFCLKAQLLDVSTALIATFLTLGLMPGCTSPQDANDGTLAVAHVSFDDYYGAYAASWVENQERIQGRYQAVRKMTFAQLYQGIRPAETALQIGDVLFAPKPDDMANAKIVMTGLGEEFATLGAFFDAFHIKPRQLTAAEFAAGLNEMANREQTSLSLDAPVMNPDQQAAHDWAVNKCIEWFNHISDAGIQAGLLNDANYAPPVTTTSSTSASNNFVAAAKTTYRSSGNLAEYNHQFWSFYSNKCKDNVRGMVAPGQGRAGQNSETTAGGMPSGMSSLGTFSYTNGASSSGASSSTGYLGGGSDGGL